MADSGGRTDNCGRMVWVKFPVHILLHACNMFLNRRLHSSFCLLSSLPNPHINTNSCVMNCKVPEKLMAFLT